MRIVFRCDASNAIGGGHVMRCLTLAGALVEAGAEVSFVAAAMPDALEERIVAAGHRLARIPASPEMHREGTGWEEPPLSAEVQLADVCATRAVAGQADWLVVDHYLLDANWHSQARSFATKILVIDDLANRSYDCDILLDQTFGRSAGDYRNRVPSRARILAGATYALLRPEFARERPAALNRRQPGGSVRRVLVSMSSANPGGITARIVELTLATIPECEIDVVLGPQVASLEQVCVLSARHPRVSVHVNSDRMAELMRDADIAIGAAGASSWERCCLGLPTISVVLADNQRFVATSLERAGAVVLADSPEEIPALLQRIAGDQRMRLSMIAATAAITDGNGAKRIADAMIDSTSKGGNRPTLRPALPEDSRMVWLWRNDHMTRCFSQANAPIAWPDHVAWWQEALKSTDRQLMIAEVAGMPVAAVRFDRAGDGGAEVSINLAPSARGFRLGARILAEACRTLREQRGPVTLCATVHRGNPASRRIFEKLGFIRAVDLSKSGFERYVLDGGTTE